MRPHRSDPQAGITLVELLVVMVIMGIVSATLVGAWSAFTNASVFGSTSSQQQDDARETLARMSREVRDAQAPATTSATAFVLAGPYEVQFYSTFNGADAADPETVPVLTRFIYKQTDAVRHIGAVYREIYQSGAWGSSMVLVKNVVNKTKSPNVPLFTYTAFGDSGAYQSDGTTTVPASQIVNVTMTLLVDLNPGHSPTYVTVQTTVQPRNTLQL